MNRSDNAPFVSIWERSLSIGVCQVSYERERERERKTYIACWLATKHPALHDRMDVKLACDEE